MKTASRVCENCREKIFGDAPKGLCPACVLETGLGPLADEAVAPTGRDDPGRVEKLPHDSAPSRPADVLRDYGDYELLEEIGRGAQGIVYRARQKSLNRTVALKVIGLGQWATQAHLKRFRLEAEAAASLDHPCIVPIYEVGERDGSCYFSMKFIDGGQLDEMAKHQPISFRNAAELIAKLARTVHHAHEHGILHRDIKPGNILIDAKGEPHLTDFGLARLVETESTLTRTMEVLGTPSYMAPEQARGQNEQLTRATDVYGLGAVFYQLLTGHPPFAGGTTYETVRLVVETEPRQPRLWNPKIDRDLSTICLKCLDKDPKRRYASALALAEDLEHWLRHEPIRARHTGVFTRGKKWVRRNPTTALLFVLSLAFAATVGVMIWKGESRPIPAGIAVLPFENPSADPENAFFTDGVQDEILTDLARIAALKVISRASVMQYKSGLARNLSKIGQQLGEAYLVEGTVQRAGNRVRVNAELVDARTDRHLWGQTYERDLADVFVIESEIAKTIANQLQAKLSLDEKNAIERSPTSDVTAFVLYSHAKTLILSTGFDTGSRQHLMQAIELLNEAVRRDPEFLLAYCQLAHAHDQLYFFNIDHTPARLGLANSAIQTALRLRPDAGEAHLALAWHRYNGYLDYDNARAEIAVAQRTLPNEPGTWELAAYIDRRQGRWEESMRKLQRATELDPRNAFILRQISQEYLLRRRYPEAAAVLDRALEIVPKDIDTRVGRAFVDLSWKADTRPMHATIQSILAENSSVAEQLAEQRLNLALCERDLVEASRALAALSSNNFGLGVSDAVRFNRAFGEGLVARVRGDAAAAHTAFAVARAPQEELVRTQPDYAPTICVLGLIDAGLGRKEDALREGRRAVELLPVAKEAINGTHMIEYFAIIAAWSGEKDLALEQLNIATRLPSLINYGYLRLHPFWDPLRGDPRFEKLVAEAAAPIPLK